MKDEDPKIIKTKRKRTRSKLKKNGGIQKAKFKSSKKTNSAIDSKIIANITNTEKETLKYIFVDRASSSTLKLLGLNSNEYIGVLTKFYFIITKVNWNSVKNEVFIAYLSLKKSKPKSRLVTDFEKYKVELKEFKKSERKRKSEVKNKINYLKFELTKEEEKEKKRAKELTRKKKRKEKSVNRKLRKEKEKKQNLLNTKEHTKTIISNAWHLLHFENRSVTILIGYKSYRFKKYTKSSKYLNHVKRLFNLRAIEFKYILDKNGKVEDLLIPTIVFTLTELGERIHGIKYPKNNRRIIDNLFCPSDYNITAREASLLLGYDKTQYLNVLIDSNSVNYKIVYIPEAIYASNEFRKIDSSFLFTLEVSKEHLFTIWESIVPNKATYVFYCGKIGNQEIRDNIIDFLVSDYQNKRTALRSKTINLVGKLESWIGVRHNYALKEDVDWLHTINKFVNTITNIRS